MSETLSFSDRAKAVSTLARVASHVALEKVLLRPATRLQEIPRSVEEVTAEWLTAVLCSKTPGARVVEFQVSGGSDGSTSRRALTIKYNEAGAAAGLPTKLFGKATPKLTSRLICGTSGALHNEVGFYRTIRPLIDIEAPAAYFADFDPASYRSFFLFRDIAVEGAQFTNPLMYIDRAKAGDMVRLMATYHARFWNDSRLEREFTWLKTALGFQEGVNVMIGFEKRSMIGIERSSGVIPPKILGSADRLWPALMRSLEINGQKSHTYLHEDIHIGNWYVSGKGRMGLCDWQCTVRGGWAGDFSYALSSALTVDDRRAWERELLTEYLEALRERGIAAPSFDQAWLEYRQQIFHAFFNWVYTIGAGAMQPSMQPDDFSVINIGRMASAMEDLDSLQSVSG